MRLSTSRKIAKAAPASHAAVDEQALAEHHSPSERKRLGAYFTPIALVDQVLDAVAKHLPPRGRVAFVDPACGAGAFLLRAAERFPEANLFGLELDAASLNLARQRVPRAVLRAGDALAAGPLEALLADVRADFEVWVGNPPYNGTSALLKDEVRWRELASVVELAPGQSLREDYLFFMLRALERLGSRRGALAFVTSSTLLDSWAYVPVRRLLSERLQLREAQALGRGVFRDTKVSTCFTVFTTHGRGLKPQPPDYLFTRPDSQALELDARWVAQGERLTTLVPFSLAGLKTRFDELLVDDDRDVLISRMRRFCAGQRVEVPERCLAKLEALPRVPFSMSAVRRFLHPRGRRAWCYVDRRLIPRGDHRFQGDWDPHLGDAKLAFNVRELPLWAQLLDEPGCVTAYQHTRFAPVEVRGEANLSERGRALGRPREVFAAIARFVMSDEVQQIWAPALGTLRDLPVPLDALDV